VSKFAQVAATSQTLSIAAMEEASRMGQREADLEHLLLALTLNEQVAGQVLRSQGITLEKAREAILETRTRQLQSIGVDANAPADGRITFHETNGYEWSKRARDIIGHAAEGKKTGDSSAVLRELLNEPSGLIEDLLRHMGASPAGLMQSLGEGVGPSARTPHGTSWSKEGAGTIQAFVPAPVEKVWALLASPARMPEWEPITGSTRVVSAGDDAVPGNVWLAFHPTHWPNGKPVRVRKGCERRRVELIAADPDANIIWRFSYPDAPRSNYAELGIMLSRAASGTQLGITFAWERGRGWRRVAGFLLTPMRRFAVWMQLRQIAGGISRAFR
jgi:uncharacterized protein YndB with AHSA1/START domain